MLLNAILFVAPNSICLQRYGISLYKQARKQEIMEEFSAESTEIPSYDRKASCIWIIIPNRSLVQLPLTHLQLTHFGHLGFSNSEKDGGDGEKGRREEIEDNL